MISYPSTPQVTGAFLSSPLHTEMGTDMSIYNDFASWSQLTGPKVALDPNWTNQSSSLGIWNVT